MVRNFNHSRWELKLKDANTRFFKPKDIVLNDLQVSALIALPSHRRLIEMLVEYYPNSIPATSQMPNADASKLASLAIRILGESEFDVASKKQAKEEDLIFAAWAALLLQSKFRECARLARKLEECEERSETARNAIVRVDAVFSPAEAEHGRL